MMGEYLGSLLDLLLNFHDFWNFVAYEYANTAWNKYAATASFKPRSTFADAHPSVEQLKAVRYKTDPETVLKVVRSESQPPPWYAREMAGYVEQLLPLKLRRVTLVTIDLSSPHYIDRFTPAEQRAYFAQAAAQVEILKSLGLNRVSVPALGFTEDDYIDRVHFSFPEARNWPRH
jgi:hypothetical protein